MHKVPTFGAVLLILALLLPTPVAADPIPVGSLRLSGALISGAGVFTQGDERVSVSGSGFVEAGLCLPCPAGTELSLSGSLSDLDGAVAFLSPSFRLPADIAPGVRWTIRMPFSFEARYYPLTGSGPTGSFEGTGIVTGEFLTQRILGEIDGELVEIFPGTFFNFISATYEVPGEQLAATPEPASLLLIGTGVLGLGLRSRWRRGASKPD